MRLGPAFGVAWRIGRFPVGLALVAEGGHRLLGAMHATLAHHWFHILLPSAAAVVFAIYLVQEIRRNGWPAFSWRLRPAAPRPTLPADGVRIN